MKNFIASEVREEILTKVKAGETVAALSKQYGVSDRSIYTWLRRKAKENQQLKEIVGILTVELERVKKRSSLGISRTVIYHPSLKLQTRQELLKQQILDVLSVHPSYGHRRIALALRVGKKRVRKAMRLFGIKPYKRKARWTKKRDLGKEAANYSNLIKGSCPIGPGLIPAGDFTRIPYQDHVVYLATFLDLYTRQIVGWQVSASHASELVIGALFDAVKTLGKMPKIIHTDQGSEYNCQDYLSLLAKMGIQVSMSQKASPWENGYQESFYDNFKTDLGLEFDRFDTFGELIEAIHHTVCYYNQDRIHTSLKTSPNHFLHLYNQR